MADGVGIDLGTTHCCLFVYKHGRDRPQLLKNKAGQATTPSWVRFEKDGQDVGQIVKNQSPENPDNTVRNAKRLIGRSFQDKAVQTEVKRMPFDIVNQNGSPMIKVQQKDDNGSIVWSKVISPEEVSTALLKNMKDIAEDFLGQEVQNVVVTVPANFMETQRAATMNAAKRAGFSGVNLMNEPTAAAIAYAGSVDDQCTILVFDFGGGTLDITVMKIKGRNVYEVLTTEGDMCLGGEDFDNEILEYFLQDIKEKHKIDLSEDTKARAILHLKAEAFKIALSHRDVRKHREMVYDLHNQIPKYEILLTKELFDSMFGDLLEKSLLTVKKALKSARLVVDDIKKVILVGGSTRLPAVKEGLQKMFGESGVVCADDDPDEAIARGAATESYRLNNCLPSRVTEVTAYHYGVETWRSGEPDDSRFISELIGRGTAYPCTFTKEYKTRNDYQTSVGFNIYQSKEGFKMDEHAISKIIVPGIPSRKKGECIFDVTFEIDRNNILNATAQGKGDINHYKSIVQIVLNNVR